MWIAAGPHGPGHAGGDGQPARRPVALAGGEPHWDAALALDPGVMLHLYGKRTPAAGRKMGHLTVLDPDPETALHRAWRRAMPWSPASAGVESACSPFLAPFIASFGRSRPAAQAATRPLGPRTE